MARIWLFFNKKNVVNLDPKNHFLLSRYIWMSYQIITWPHGIVFRKESGACVSPYHEWCLNPITSTLSVTNRDSVGVHQVSGFHVYELQCASSIIYKMIFNCGYISVSNMKEHKRNNARAWYAYWDQQRSRSAIKLLKYSPYTLFLEIFLNIFVKRKIFLFFFFLECSPTTTRWDNTLLTYRYIRVNGNFSRYLSKSNSMPCF